MLLGGIFQSDEERLASRAIGIVDSVQRSKTNTRLWIGAFQWYSWVAIYEVVRESRAEVYTQLPSKAAPEHTWSGHQF